MLIIILKFILNQPQKNGITWVMNEKEVSGKIERNKYFKLRIKNGKTNYSSKKWLHII